MSHKEVGKILGENVTNIATWEEDKYTPRKQYVEDLLELFSALEFK